MRASTLGALVVCLFALSCEEEKITTSSGQKPVAQAAEDEAKATEEPTVAVTFQEVEFVESERSRDPFRSFASTFVQEGKGRVRSQREVVLSQYSVDELKLVGIVTRINPPKAMLVDPRGMGHVVSRGQFVGRPVVVQPASGLGAAYEVNWRIDQIREGDVVLVREDPANPDVPNAIRVIALRTENEELVAASEGDQALNADPAALDRQVEELRQRLESVEQRGPTAPRPAGAAEPTVSSLRSEASTVVRAPRAN